MDEPKKALNSNSLRCETHNIRHGPTGCPICSRPPEPAPVVGFPVVDHSLSGVALLADFWRRYGMKSVGLLALGLTSLYTFAWPKPTSAIDPTPYRQPITELESVLFYSGPTDPEAHPKILLTLVPSLVTALKAKPPAYRAESLIGAVEGIETSIRFGNPQTFRLTGPRRIWVQVREDFLDDATWFRLRDDQLDTAQNRLQTDPPPGAAENEMLGIIEAYSRALERFVARAGQIAAQACTDVVDKSNLAAEFRSLSTDTLAELDAIVANSETAKTQLSYLIGQARSLVRGRKESACGIAVPHPQALTAGFSAFEEAAAKIRSRLESGTR